VIRMNKILLFALIINTISDIVKIKSNKEVIKADNKVYEAQQGLKIQLDERNKILKDSQKVLKESLSIDYEQLTEEVIKRINKKTKRKEIILNIGSEEIGRVTADKLKNAKINQVLGD